MIDFLIKFLLSLKYKNRKKQPKSIQDISLSYSFSGEDNKVMKINSSLTDLSIGLYLDNDYIILNKHQSTILLEMVKKSVDQIESIKK